LYMLERAWAPERSEILRFAQDDNREEIVYA